MSTIEERVAALESALASMTATEKRIVELPAASSVANDDFVALDGVANGSRRFAASNLGGKAEVMTEDEWDALPSSKLTDGKVYALSGVSPSTQDNPLWQKLGFASLDTQADDCSDAINELNTGLTTLNSNLTYKSITIPSSYINSKITVTSVYGGVRGGVAEFYLYGTANANITAWETLVTVPDELKPHETNDGYFININNTLYPCNFNVGGIVNTRQAVSSGQTIRFKVTYISAI